MQIDTSYGEFAAAGGHHILSAAQLDQLAARRKTRQCSLQLASSVALRARLPHQLFEIGAGMRQAGDMVQQRLVRHNPILLATPDKLVASISFTNRGVGWGIYGSSARQVSGSGSSWEAARQLLS